MWGRHYYEPYSREKLGKAGNNEIIDEIINVHRDKDRYGVTEFNPRTYHLYHNRISDPKLKE
ncbi:MAG: hypothetical protein C0179_01135 [Fervidicoccus sp.]|nr:MAG: hypothetical protein C0179_01135 [Fervidicoccus sp.]